MKTSAEIKQKRSELYAQANDLVQLAKNEKRELTAEEKTSFDAKVLEADGLEEDEKRAVAFEKVQARNANPVNPTPSKSEAKELNRFSLSKTIMEYTERGIDGVTGFEKEILQESQKEAKRLGVVSQGLYLGNQILDSMSQKRTMTAAVAADGGNLIPTDKVDFFEALFPMMVLGKLGVQKLTGLSANTDIPGITSSVVTGWADGETGTQTPDDPTIANRTLRPKLVYGATNISKRLLLQTNNSVDSMIMNDIMKGIANAIEIAVINGTGANGQPTGIIGTSGIENVAIGTHGGAITLAKLLQLIEEVQTANANSANCKFLINPKTVAKLKQTPIDSGSGAMIMAYGNYFGGISGQIDGYEALVTSNVPSNLTKGTTSGVCSAVLFGDFSQVVLGQFGGVDLIIDPYTLARTGTVALTINQYVDMAVKQPSVLGAILDATTT
jgi:HK97 family phage major capsid protein